MQLLGFKDLAESTHLGAGGVVPRTTKRVPHKSGRRNEKSMTGPKILTLDIETSPLKVYTWGLFKQNIGINQIIDPTRVICWAAKWHDKPSVIFRSEFHDGQEAMLDKINELINEADIVVHFNGGTFDMPHLRRELSLAGYPPYSPVQEVDLLRVVKNRFRFPSNKLDYVSQAFGLDGKLSHTGFDLWRDCLDGDEKAWNLMRRYNKQDVVLTEQLYDVLRPYIPNHPNMGLFLGEDVCTNCGSDKLERRGYRRTLSRTYQRYLCLDCGKWMQSTRSVDGSGFKAIA